MDLQQLHQTHRRHLAAARRSPATLEYYRYALEPLSAFLEERGLAPDTDSLSKPIMQEFQLWMREQRGMRPGGEHAVLRGVRASIRWAHAEELIQDDPLKRFQLPPVPKVTPPATSDEEAREALRVVKHMEQPLRNTAMLLTLLDTGVRLGELIGLRTTDVDLERGLLRVRAETSKRGKQRMIPLGVKAGRALAAYERRERAPVYDHVQELFLGRTGTPMTKGVVEHIMVTISQRCGIPRSHVAPHAWRRAFATGFLRHGGDIATLQQLMGHSSIDQTRVYLRLTHDDLQRVHLRASPADRL